MHTLPSQHLESIGSQRGYDRSAFVLAVSAAYARLSELRDRLDDVHDRLVEAGAREALVIERRTAIGAEVLAAETQVRLEREKAEDLLAEIAEVAEREARRILSRAQAEVDAMRAAAAQLSESEHDADVLDIRGHIDSVFVGAVASAHDDDEVVAT